MDLLSLVAESHQDTLAQVRAGVVHDEDFNAFRTLARRVNLIMDVGANRGQSIASLKSIYPDATIHAFEANPMFFAGLDGLRSLFGQTLRVHPYGLGQAPGTIHFFIPWVGQMPYLEESSTRSDYFEKPWVVEKFRQRGELRLEETVVELRPGDQLNLDPDIVKIDVEGAEHDVLLGLRETLVRSHPILLVENSDWHNVTALLGTLDYLPFRWEAGEGRLVPFYGECTNTFYLHRSTIDDMDKGIRRDA